LRLLLDTHILVRALIEPARLRPEVRDALEDPDNDILFSAASIWEIAIKAALGRGDFGVAPETFVEEALRAGFNELPVRSNAATRVATLPHHHRDPFDRLLLAQAMTEPAMLYTADALIATYSEMVVIV
jgi:PIN domain nuclease of toxin-antitoxin system